MVKITDVNKFNASQEHSGMEKSVIRIQSIKIMVVHLEHIGTGSSVPALLTLALKEPNGLVTIVKLYKKNVNQDSIGLALFVQLYLLNVLHC